MLAYIGHHKALSIGITLTLLALLFVASQILWLRLNGTPVPRPLTSRQPVTTGKGPALTYVVLGDSTAVSQGSRPEEGFAYGSAAHLAERYRVTWTNHGVPGARAADVAAHQAPEAAAQKPDIALIAVGANDVTHLTRQASVIDSLYKTVWTLRHANPDVLIVLTGAPDMGSPPRIPQPLRWLAGEHSASLNGKITDFVKHESVVLAPIAEKTGPAFRRDHSLFAADNFHPNAQGYALWTPVINQALDHALGSAR